MLKVNEVLCVREISKNFGPTKALDKINLSLNSGEILGIAGENGAGKSTLMGVIGGLYRPDRGELFISGRKVSYDHPREAISSGISVVYQDLNLFKNLSIAENIFIDRIPKKAGIIDWKKLKFDAKKLIDAFELELEPMNKVINLSTGVQQLVEILKAVSFKQRIVIMDEPTSSLNNKEIETLFTIINKLKEKGTAVIFISHHIEEVIVIADRIVLLRDGKKVLDELKDKVKFNQIVARMIGREIADFYPKKFLTKGKIALSAIDLSRGTHFKNISLDLREKEIIGIVGLRGSGAKELGESLAGLHHDISGVIKSNGKILEKYSPGSFLKLGIAFISENRTMSLFFNFSILKNISISILHKLKKWMIVHFRKEKKIVEDLTRSLNIKYSSIIQGIGELSGGNRQKVLVARALAVLPRVLILDDPTKGIDIGTKTEIYCLVTNFLENNGSILLFSSDMDEVLNLCDKIIIMYKGEIVKEIQYGSSKEELTSLIVGGGKV